MGSSVEEATAVEHADPQSRQDPPIPLGHSTSAKFDGNEALRGRHSRGTSLRERTISHFKPQREIGPPPTMLQSFKAILLSSYLNLLLFCIPVSWALHFALPESTKNDVLIFVFSFLAIIPLAKLLSFATEELSLRVGQTLAGLMNATLGNAVELIVAIIALAKCQLRIVQASLVGSVLSNLLLVLGMCFFAGGMRYSEQGFGLSSTQLNSTLLTISVIAVLLPAAFHFSADAQLTDQVEQQDILAVSHGVAIILLFIYGCYLAFQLYSHKALYEDSGEHVVTTRKYTTPKFRLRKKKGLDPEAAPNSATIPNTANTDAQFLPDSMQTLSPRAEYPPTGPLTAQERLDGEEEQEQPQMSVLASIILLVVVTVFVALTAEFLLDSIQGVTNTGVISKEFVGIILLPIVGNAAEHVTAVTVSVKDKLNLSLGVAVGSSIQIALFVIPFIVTLAWIMGKPLTLLFDPYESIAMFLSVLTVNYVVQDGRSNWLEGMILMCLYLILAVTFWYYPAYDPSKLLDTCK
ncbi:calcium/proton exchanger [Crepidotus variabilis]|uniref:Calcium/proton exchanger n=1 Tax=Crepidotus variabilis TaxID=179855 RepID=A0A9P6EAW9_9AGAR|nr:calcium/proton exchanger [Crepidotus variabilis]